MSDIIQSISSIITQYWLDFLTGTIVLFSIIRGIQIGALRSLVSLFGWVAAIVLAFFAQPATADFVRDYTPVYQIIQNAVQEGLAEEMLGKSSLVMSQYLNLPEILSNTIQKASQTLAYSLAESIAVLAINVLTFVCLVFGLKLIFFLIHEIVSAARKAPVIRTIDRLLGVFVGAARGVIVVAVLMILLLGLQSVTSSEFLSTSITKSRLAKEVYNRNYILLMIQQVGGHKSDHSI